MYMNNENTNYEVPEQTKKELQKTKNIYEMVNCPICDAKIKWKEDVEENEIISCQECQSDLEIMCLYPNIELALPPKEVEDMGE